MSFRRKSGEILVETIFNWPGVGQTTSSSVWRRLRRDKPGGRAARRP